MKKPYPIKKATSAIKDGKPKKLTEYGGLEKYTSKSAMMKHEKSEGKKKEMSEGKSLKSKSPMKMTSDSASMPKSKSGMGLKNTIKKVAKKATEMVAGKPKRKTMSTPSKGKAFM